VAFWGFGVGASSMVGFKRMGGGGEKEARGLVEGLGGGEGVNEIVKMLRL
jgi:hypothetical protein